MTQSLVLLVAFFFIAMNFILDILFAWLDPRVRFK
jgi:peptide/nickel transport system permease protein